VARPAAALKAGAGTLVDPFEGASWRLDRVLPRPPREVSRALLGLADRHRVAVDEAALWIEEHDVEGDERAGHPHALVGGQDSVEGKQRAVEPAERRHMAEAARILDLGDAELAAIDGHDLDRRGPQLDRHIKTG
jgi:hypothetical protein